MIMNIKLIWVNRNVKPAITRLYRLANANDPLVTPIATLTSNETSYVDNDIVNGATYYYVLTISDGTTTLTTTPIRVLAVYNTGPGPTYLRWGDLTLGYYGTVSYMDLFTRSELLASMGLPEAGTSAALPVYDKWSRNGITYFVPRTSIGGYQPSAIYNAGAMFGVDGPGYFIPSNAVSTPQNKTISKNGFVYTPMAPTGANDLLFPDQVPAGTDIYLARGGSMVADFFYPAWSNVISPVQKSARLIGAIEQSTSMNSGYGLTQNRIGTNLLTATGSTSTAPGTVGALEALTVTTQTATIQYRPVLRLETAITLG